jgi:hypothetical protein
MRAFFFTIIFSSIFFSQKTIKLSNKSTTSFIPTLSKTIADKEGYYQSISVSANKNGLFYLLDTGNKKVLVYNKKGEKVNEFGKEGSGPGELMNVFQIFTNKNRIFIREEMKAHIYDLSGKYINDISLVYNGEIAHFQLIDQRAALITENNGKIQLQFIDDDGNKSDEIGKLEEAKNFDSENQRIMIRIGAPYYSYKNSFIKIFKDDYSIGIYKYPDLKLDKIIKKDFEKVERDFSRYNIKVDIDDDSMSKEEIAKQQQEMMKRLQNRMGKYEDDILSVLGQINNVLFIRVASLDSKELRIHAIKDDKFLSELTIKENDRIIESRMENDKLLICMVNKETGPYAKIYTLSN